MPDPLTRRFLLPAALVAFVALTALAVVPASGAKEKSCADAVVADWYGDGRVDEIFPIHCYQEAIRSLPVDVLDYSNAKEDILRALAYARQDKPDPGPAGGGSRPTGTPTGTGTDTTATPPGDDDPGDSGPGDSGGGQTVAVNDVDTSGPSSLPIPLLILGGLALLLLAAGGAGYLSRRAQARREGGPPGPA